MSDRHQPSQDVLTALQDEIKALRRELEQVKRRPFRLGGFRAELAGDTLTLVSETTGYSTTIARHAP